MPSCSNHGGPNMGNWDSDPFYFGHKMELYLERRISGDKRQCFYGEQSWKSNDRGIGGIGNKNQI